MSEYAGEHKITVLLVDDQEIIAQAVKQMLAGQEDIIFHYCQDPTEAIEKAIECEATVILQDLVMPEIDGLTLVRYFRANEQTREIPLIVLSTKEEAKMKAEAFALGANDYMVKLPDRVEMLARLRYHSTGYIRLLERNEVYRKLVENQEILREELREAANYVTSLLPPPLTGAVETSWCFVPSTALGGDSFGYHWIDDDHFALYLLDVCGHGVGPALHSISAIHAISSRSLPGTDFTDPAAVLSALNRAFDMETHNNLFFTMWYGVYQKSTRRLRYSSGGHPPAILITGESKETAEVKQLKTAGLVIGAMQDSQFSVEECSVGAYNKLFVYSDGVFELDQADGTVMALDTFLEELVNRSSKDTKTTVDEMLQFAKEIQRSETLPDDFSIVELSFN